MFHVVYAVKYIFVIYALYPTISLLMHLFCSGHVSLLLQLQLAVLMTCGWLFLDLCVLCFDIMVLTLFMQL